MPQKPPNNELYADLKALIDKNRNKEHECRHYLQYVDYLLFRETTIISYEYKETEYRANSGNSDYVISAKIKDGSGIECVRAYVWELKAPQCYIFEKDTENRLRPTSHLVTAENQLLHYYHNLKGDEQFRHEFKVSHPNNVLVGGIIIGCSQSLVKGDYDEPKKANLYEKAIMTRQYFYNSVNLKLMTWDTILDQFRSDNVRRQQDRFDSTVSSEPVSIPKKVRILSHSD